MPVIAQAGKSSNKQSENTRNGAYVSHMQQAINDKHNEGKKRKKYDKNKIESTP